MRVLAEDPSYSLDKLREIMGDHVAVELQERRGEGT
jgi:hypothetical protein